MDEPKLHLWETGVMRITRHPQMVGQAIWWVSLGTGRSTGRAGRSTGRSTRRSTGRSGGGGAVRWVQCVAQETLPVASLGSNPP